MIHFLLYIKFVNLRQKLLRENYFTNVSLSILMFNRNRIGLYLILSGQKPSIKSKKVSKGAKITPPLGISINLIRR